MDSDNLGESLIGEKSMGFQRWRKLCSLVKNRKRRFRFTAATALSPTTHVQEKFRIAILVSQAAFHFINGIDGLDIYSQDKEHTVRTEEGNNVGSSYYCHQCDEIVTATVDVNMTCPVCQGCFVEEFVGVISSLHHAKFLESEPSVSDSNGHGTIEILPSNQSVLDIVENKKGSALDSLPFHSRSSHDYNNYGQTNQALGHDDSNLGESLLTGVGSDDAVTINVPGHVVPSVASSDTGVNVSPDQPHHGTRVVFETQHYHHGTVVDLITQ